MVGGASLVAAGETASPPDIRDVVRLKRLRARRGRSGRCRFRSWRGTTRVFFSTLPARAASSAWGAVGPPVPDVAIVAPRRRAINAVAGRPPVARVTMERAA